MRMHWNQKSNIYLNIWLAPCPSQCNYFLVFDIALIRWTLLQSKRTVFVGQNLKAKQIVFAGRREYVWFMFFQAMYEGILVDLPFATFFLSKLKQKYSLSLPLFWVCVCGCVICFHFIMLFVLYIFFVDVSLCIWSSTHLSGTIF